MTRVVLVESVAEKILVSDVRRVNSGFWGPERRNFLVTNTRGLELKRGDFVEIFLPTGSTVLQSAVTFLLPLILFSAVYGTARAILPETGDGILFLVGFGALLLGFPLGSFLCRILGVKFPNVLKVLAAKRALESEDCSGCGVCIDFDCQIRKN